jgi:hypothetical protein
MHTAEEDEIAHRDRRIVELREEVDQLRDLVRRMEEDVEESDNVIESWKETFDTELTDSGSWTWKPFWDQQAALVDKYNELVRRWKKYLPLIRRQNVGRPLAASHAQCEQVRKLRKAGRPLRSIADETGLGLNTVRTIVVKAEGTDRATKGHWRRIEPDRAEATRWKRQRRTGNALPGQAQRAVENGRALLKEAKGLGRD